LPVGSQARSMATGEEDHGHGGHHHLPAVEDWPRGFGEASVWPFISAIGGSGFYVGAGLFILGQGDNPVVDPLIGAAVFVASTFVFLAGLYGWLYHAFIVDFWDGAGSIDSARALRFGMVLFLGTEIATFGAGFIYYFFVRGTAEWTAVVRPPGLLGSLVLINTAILIASSVTIHYAHLELLKGNRKNFVRLLLATVGLGAVFIAGQVYEYYEFIVHEGFTVTEGIFASAFFGLTGLHGLHVSLGAVLLAIVTIRALYGQYSPERHVSVSTVSMYWHFVDVVWIFLVVVLYVGAVL